MAMPPMPQCLATQGDNNLSRTIILTKLLMVIESKLVFLAMEVRGKQLCRWSRPVNSTSFFFLLTAPPMIHPHPLPELCVQSHSIDVATVSLLLRIGIISVFISRDRKIGLHPDAIEYCYFKR